MRRILLPAPSTLDLLKYERDVYIDEILKRTRLLFSSIDPNLNRFGIVDSVDPRTSLEGDTRPFVVRVNAADPATVDVLPGTAVFSSGEVLPISEGAFRLPVPGGVGTKSVVYLYFDESEVDPVLTRYDTLSHSRVDFLGSSSSYVRITTRAEYDTLSPTDLERTIPLAQITVQEVVAGLGTTTELVVDMGNSSLDVNRPWFSVVDLEHRSFKGTGLFSENNPHALSLNDISATDSFTLFQLHLDHGMIVSKDETLAKLPGNLCEEEILAGAIQVDIAGSVTGVAGAYWFRTDNFPTQILRATDPQKIKDYAPMRIPRSNIVFLLPRDEYIPGRNIFVYYTTTDSCEPPTELPLTSLEFKSKGDREVIISDGLIVDNVVDTVHSFEDAGPTPQRYTVYLDGEGYFQRYPQTLSCYKKVTDLGFTLQEFDNPMVGRGRLKVALTNAVAGPTLDVSVQITGTSSDGSILTETVSFDSSWAGNPVGSCSELESQFVFTSNYFSTITNFIVTSNVDSGPDASLTFFADVNPRDTEELSDILPVAETLWDGLQVCFLEDIRPINTTMHLPKVTKHSAAGIPLSETTISFWPGYMFNFWVEDFDKPKFLCTEFTDTSTSFLPSLSTSMRKEEEGLHRRDRYVGRPIAVRPHTSTPVAIRFVPIEPDRDFTMWARFFDGTGVWSDWTPLSGFVSPQYTIDLSVAASPVVKWQVIVQGESKGLITTYVTDGPGIPASFVFDVGVWDRGTYT